MKRLIKIILRTSSFLVLASLVFIGSLVSRFIRESKGQTSTSKGDGLFAASIPQALADVPASGDSGGGDSGGDSGCDGTSGDSGGCSSC